MIICQNKSWKIIWKNQWRNENLRHFFHLEIEHFDEKGSDWERSRMEILFNFVWYSMLNCHQKTSINLWEGRQLLLDFLIKTSGEKLGENLPCSLLHIHSFLQKWYVRSVKIDSRVANIETICSYTCSIVWE